MAARTDSLALFVVLIAYFALAFLWPSFRVWRMTGLNPYVLASSDDAHGLVTAGMRAVLAGIFAYAALQLGWPELEPALGALTWLDRPLVAASGWIGLAAAMAWTVVTQYQMGASWRIGIDQRHRTELVTSGLFGLSRNPIFLGMRVCLVCLLLLRPNAVTLALMLVGELLVQLQVRLEEAYLREQHGARYDAYCAKVRRWI